MKIEYPIRASAKGEPADAKVEPNESAPMPVKIQRASRIVDVVGLPANVVVVRASFGRMRFSRDEMQCSLADFLARQPYEAKKGAYGVFTAMNLGSKAVEVTGRIVVDELEAQNPSEHADAEVQAEHRDEATRQSRSDSRRNPDNDALVEAIIDGAEMGSAKERGAKRRAGEAGEATRQSRGSKAKTKTQRGRRPMPATVSLTRSMKPQRILSLKERRERMGLPPKETASKKARSSGGEGEAASLLFNDRVIALHVGYAEMLEMVLTAGIPLSEDARAGIGAALQASVLVGATPSLYIGEVAVRISNVDFERLSEAIEVHVEYALEDTDAMATSIRNALAGPSARAAAASSPPAEAPSVESDPRADFELGLDLEHLDLATNEVGGATQQVPSDEAERAAEDGEAPASGATVTPITSVVGIPKGDSALRIPVRDEKVVPDDGRPDNVNSRPGAVSGSSRDSAANEA